MPKFNKTKIIATLGPASNSKEILTELIEAGVDVFRLNFSHSNHETHAKTIQLIREVNEETKTNVGILADLQGPKIRTGEIEGGKVMLKTGDKFILTTRQMVGNSKMAYISYDRFPVDVNVNDPILIDDGMVELKTISTNGSDEVECLVVQGGLLKTKKGINLPQTKISIPSLTEKDIKDLKFILTQDINWIALSFVRSANDVIRLKGIIDFSNHEAKVIAKIEKPEAIEHIDHIIEVSDAIMVARGDLGVEMPIERIPLLQKSIVRKCLNAAKPVVIATQMMESMIENPAPTRAEVTDVANAMFDGADALMLSGETAVGKNPVRVIEYLERVIVNMEKQDVIYNKDLVPDKASPTFLSDAVCYNACRISEEVNAKAIIGMTKSGYTAFLLSSYRPRANIFVFTESKSLLNTVSLIWGVRAYPYHKFVSTDDTIKDVQQILIDNEELQSGDIVINTGSMPLHERGMTNTIKVSRID